jgi:hypothetical protein
MKKIIFSLVFILSCAILAIGIWEATVAYNNSPQNSNLTSNDEEMYALTITKSVCNILGGIISMIISLFGYIFANDDDDDSKNNNKERNGSLLQLINFGVSIWALVRYFDGNFNNNSLMTDYKDVLTVEMIVFFITLGIIGVTILFVILFCCFACCTNNISDNAKTINNGKTINTTNISTFATDISTNSTQSPV